MDSTPPKVAYSIADIEAVAPFRKTTLYKHIRLGNLRCHRVGRRTFVMHDDLIAFLRSLGTD